MNRDKDDYRRNHRERNRSPPRKHNERSREQTSRDDRKRRHSRDRTRDSRQDHHRSHVKHERTSEPQWGTGETSKDSKGKPIVKDKPNFNTTGKLAEDTNTFNGVVIKYSEPEEARKPRRMWRLYPFKGEKELPVLHMHRQSGYLLGRDRKVADFPIDHPSCSKQHAAFQYRLVTVQRNDGTVVRQIKPYLMDLDSANGTFINNNKIEPRRYYELMEKDVIKFGYSLREYVLLHEHSKDSDEDDDVKEEEENTSE